MLDHAWVKALFIVVLHLVAPYMRPWLLSRERAFNAFGGGMAISYVFIHLLPEVSEGREELGGFTFIFVLVGYVFFYLMHLLGRGRDESPKAKRWTYQVGIVGLYLYCMAMVLGLPAGLVVLPIHMALMAVAMGIHIMHEDFEIGSENPVPFDRRGRYVLASSLAVGLVVRWYLLPESGLISHAITSLLAAKGFGERGLALVLAAACGDADHRHHSGLDLSLPHRAATQVPADDQVHDGARRWLRRRLLLAEPGTGCWHLQRGSTTPAVIGGHPIAAGTYALYTIPGADTWTIIIHANTKMRSLAGNVFQPKLDEGFVLTPDGAQGLAPATPPRLTSTTTTASP